MDGWRVSDNFLEQGEDMGGWKVWVYCMVGCMGRDLGVLVHPPLLNCDTG